MERNEGAVVCTRPLIPHLQMEGCLKCCPLTLPASQLTAQMIDDTSRALWLYTLKQTACQRQRECQSPSQRKREKMCKTCNGKGTRKERVTSNYDLVTAYSNFRAAKPGTFQPDATSSVTSHDIALTSGPLFKLSYGNFLHTAYLNCRHFILEEQFIQNIFKKKKDIFSLTPRTI